MTTADEIQTHATGSRLDATLRERILRAMELGAAFTTLLTDRHMTVQWVSDSVVDSLGYLPEELVGMNGVTLLHREDVESTMDLFTAQVANPVGYHAEGDPARRALNTLRFRHKKGHYVAIEMAVTNLSDDDVVGGFFLYARHADERYYLEEAYRRLAAGAPADAVVQSTTAMLRSQFLDAEISITMDFGDNAPLSDEDRKDPWCFVVRDLHGKAIGGIRVRTANGPARPSEWVRTVVGRAEGILRLLSQHEKLLAQLRHAAVTDELTGAMNRRGLLDVFESMRRRPTPTPTALLYLDIDDFKRVNETYGHITADEVLKAIVHRLTNAVRDGDSVVRLGGDEFAILCRRVLPEEGAETVARRIIEQFRAPITVDGVQVTVSASIGVAVTHHGRYELLLAGADEALRQAKAEGKARSVVTSVDAGLQAARWITARA